MLYTGARSFQILCQPTWIIFHPEEKWDDCRKEAVKKAGERYLPPYEKVKLSHRRYVQISVSKKKKMSEIYFLWNKRNYRTVKLSFYLTHVETYKFVISV